MIVEEDGTYTIYPAETSRSIAQQDSFPEALIVHDPFRADPTNEYFVLEYRAVQYMTGTMIDEGMAIWQIHDTFAEERDSRRSIRLIRPEVWEDDTKALWDGTESHCYDLTPFSSPRNTDWLDGTRSYIDILGISDTGSSMTVEIRLPGVFVDEAHVGTEHGTREYPYDTVAEGVSNVYYSGRKQTIRIAPGSYLEDGQTINVPCTLVNSSDTGSVYIGP
jgi:hypothetical protein